DRSALVLEHLAERVAPDYLAHAVAHHAVDLLLGGLDPAREFADEVARTRDPPDGVVVDPQLLAVPGLDRERRGAVEQPAAPAGEHLLHERDRERGSRL